MTLITLDEAAARIGAPRETIEEWVRTGLLKVQVFPPAVGLIPVVGIAAPRPIMRVDEEELFERAESMGWFELSTENWDGEEAE